MCPRWSPESPANPPLRFYLYVWPMQNYATCDAEVNHLFPPCLLKFQSTEPRQWQGSSSLDTVLTFPCRKSWPALHGWLYTIIKCVISTRIPQSPIRHRWYGLVPFSCKRQTEKSNIRQLHLSAPIESGSQHAKWHHYKAKQTPVTPMSISLKLQISRWANATEINDPLTLSQDQEGVCQLRLDAVPLHLELCKTQVLQWKKW